jgi:hypothetical protein
MNIEAKLLKMEEYVFGRAGLPSWAVDAAEKIITTRHIYQPSIKILEQALMKEDPTFKPKPREPHPISDSTDVDEVAAVLVERFEVRQHYEAWLQLRYDAGALRMKNFLEELKAEGVEE